MLFIQQQKHENTFSLPCSTCPTFKFGFAIARWLYGRLIAVSSLFHINDGGLKRKKSSSGEFADRPDHQQRLTWRDQFTKFYAGLRAPHRSSHKYILFPRSRHNLNTGVGPARTMYVCSKILDPRSGR